MHRTRLPNDPHRAIAHIAFFAVFFGLGANCSPSRIDDSSPPEPRSEITDACLERGVSLAGNYEIDRRTEFWTHCAAAVPEICQRFIADRDLSEEEIAGCRIIICEASPSPWACEGELGPLASLCAIAAIDEDAPPPGFLTTLGAGPEALELILHQHRVDPELNDGQFRALNFAMLANTYGRARVIHLHSPRSPE